MKVIFTSFYPLCCTKTGRSAIVQHNFHPYIDGSCRREPDFENSFPAITGLCRPRFVNRLSVKDLVIYTTNILGIGEKKLVAIFEVINIVENHILASEWYITNNNSQFPNNIMVDQTKAFDLDETHRRTGCGRCSNDIDTIKVWDDGYLKRSKDHPKVAICKIWEEKLFLNSPPEMTREDIISIFNKIPMTQNPPTLKNDEWPKFQKWLLRNT